MRARAGCRSRGRARSPWRVPPPHDRSAPFARPPGNSTARRLTRGWEPRVSQSLHRAASARLATQLGCPGRRGRPEPSAAGSERRGPQGVAPLCGALAASGSGIGARRKCAIHRRLPAETAPPAKDRLHGTTYLWLTAAGLLAHGNTRAGAVTAIRRRVPSTSRRRPDLARRPRRDAGPYGLKGAIRACLQSAYSKCPLQESDIFDADVPAIALREYSCQTETIFREQSKIFFPMKS